MIEAIEAREQAERIRQGYLTDPALEGPSSAPRFKPIAGPSKSNGAAQLNTRPSFTKPDTRPVGQTGQPRDSPTSGGPGTQADIVPPPGQTVDPITNDNPADLRKLAEEDTKRRIQERGDEGDLRQEGGRVEGVDIGTGAGGGGLAPRRRGKK